MRPPRARLPWLLFTMALLAFTLPPRDLHAAEHRVVVLEADPALLDALALALSAWHVALVRVALPSPGASLPAALKRARNLCLETHADAVVWVSLADEGFTLWLYDAGIDRASARALESPPPFDATTAAAISLSIKTMLRATEVAPTGERFGAPQGSADAPGLLLHLAVGGVVRSGTPDLVEPRVLVGASAWPALLKRRVGVAIALASGAGVPTEQAAFSGTLRDTSFQIAIAGRLPLGEIFAIEAAAAGAVHLVTLDGYLAADRVRADVKRLTPALEPRVTLDAALFGGRVRLGPTVALTCLFRTHRFFVRGAEVLALAPVAIDGGLRLSFTLD